MHQTNTRNPTGFLLRDLITLLNLPKTVRSLQAPGSSATLNRLFQSEHVRDLKLIAGVATWIMVLGAVVVLAAIIQRLIGGDELAICCVCRGSLPDDCGYHWHQRACRCLGLPHRKSAAGFVDLFASEITTGCCRSFCVGDYDVVPRRDDSRHGATRENCDLPRTHAPSRRPIPE